MLRVSINLLVWPYMSSSLEGGGPEGRGLKGRSLTYEALFLWKGVPEGRGLRGRSLTYEALFPWKGVPEGRGIPEVRCETFRLQTHRGNEA